MENAMRKGKFVFTRVNVHGLYLETKLRSPVLTQNVRRSQLVEVAELIIAVKHCKYAHNGHQNNVSRGVLCLEAIARIPPSVAQRFNGWLVRHHWIAVSTRGAFVDAEHAGRECDQSYNHFPRM